MFKSLLSIVFILVLVVEANSRAMHVGAPQKLDNAFLEMMAEMYKDPKLKAEIDKMSPQQQSEFIKTAWDRSQKQKTCDEAKAVPVVSFGKNFGPDKLYAPGGQSNRDDTQFNRSIGLLMFGPNGEQSRGSGILLGENCNFILTAEHVNRDEITLEYNEVFANLVPEKKVSAKYNGKKTTYQKIYEGDPINDPRRVEIDIGMRKLEEPVTNFNCTKEGSPQLYNINKSNQSEFKDCIFISMQAFTEETMDQENWMRYMQKCNVYKNNSSNTISHNCHANGSSSGGAISCKIPELNDKGVIVSIVAKSIPPSQEFSYEDLKRYSFGKGDRPSFNIKNYANIGPILSDVFIDKINHIIESN